VTAGNFTRAAARSPAFEGGGDRARLRVNLEQVPAFRPGSREVHKIWKWSEDYGVKRIFVDKRVWRSSRNNWISFESDPRLRVTKRNIYGRCVPCIRHLYEQLKEGRDMIELGEAFTCWKVITVVKDVEECLEVLRRYEEHFLGEHDVKGKFGSSQPSNSSKVLMFHTENEEERDRLLEELKSCVQDVNPHARVFYQRACTNLHHNLLGDWRRWRKVTRVRNPDARNGVLERARRLLQGEWEPERGPSQTPSATSKP
jgi:hypothetical protein